MRYCRRCYINIPLYHRLKSCICALLYHHILAELKRRHQAWRRLFCCVRKRFRIYGTVLGTKAPNTAPYFVVALKPKSPCAVGISGRCGLSRQPFLAPTLSPAIIFVVEISAQISEYEQNIYTGGPGLLFSLIHGFL